MDLAEIWGLINPHQELGHRFHKSDNVGESSWILARMDIIEYHYDTQNSNAFTMK